MEIQYMAQNKVVAFLDIIGFSNLVSERITDREFIRKLDFTLKFGRNILEDSLRLDTDINARMFSDCICASSAADNVLDVMN